ncbi:hypothetical protein A3715_37665 [Oleiphilus sp. HI0009]|nr:hypothetical protein A3715_37665 [Oleiphilus sp. HI0009]
MKVLKLTLITVIGLALVACGGSGATTQAPTPTSTAVVGSDQTDLIIDLDDEEEKETYYVYYAPEWVEKDVTEETLFQNANGVTHALTYLLYEHNRFIANSVVPTQYNASYTPSATATEACELGGAYTAEVYAPSKTEQGYNRVLYANEYMNIHFNQCAAVMFKDVLYADGQHNTKVLRGAYNSTDAIVNPTAFVEEFKALATYDDQMVHTYQNGSVEHFVTETFHQVKMDDYQTHDTFRQHGYSTLQFRDAELTVTEITGSNNYSASFQLTNTEAFGLSVRTANNIYTVDIKEPVIVDRFTGDAIFDGLVEVTAGNTTFQIEYEYTYANVSLDSDGDGTFDTFLIIENIYYD